MIFQFEANSPLAPSSYYDHNGHIRTNSAAFGQPPHNGHPSYYSHPPPPPQAYGPIGYYGQHINTRGDFLTHSAGFDTRKRGYDDLNDFFGSAKRRQVDPTSYAQVGRSLMPLHGALSVHTGGIAAEYMAAPPSIAVGAGGGPSHGPLAQHYYLPPMPSLRTKGDLEQIDQILEQMQSTVYENSGSSPGTQYTPAFDLRHQSPAARPNVANEHYAVSAAQMPSPLTAVSSTHSSGTPAHTPPSSTMSYTSGHSPSSSSGLSPGARHPSSTSVAYPTLPAVTYPGSSTATTLGSSFNPVERRLSGGMLQSASGGRRAADDVEMAATPKAVESAISSVSSPSEESDNGAEPEPYENWLQNVRVIEFLREYVQDRLKRRQYEESSSSDDERIDPSLDIRNQAARPLYPVLRMDVD